MTVKLFHFSENKSIERFDARPVEFPSRRANGKEWLNGPLVWAIDDWHQAMYLFPRDCPRILIWRTTKTIAKDADQYFSDTQARMLVYIEKSWLARVSSASLYRYELPTTTFESLDDAGMWVSQFDVVPIEKKYINNLTKKLEQENVMLRVLDDLTPLKDIWNSTLHASGIRLRNARNWEHQDCS